MPGLKLYFDIKKTKSSKISNRRRNSFQNIVGSGTATLAITSKDMENTIKTVKSLEDSDLLIKGISKTIENEAKVQKGGFAGTL